MATAAEAEIGLAAATRTPLVTVQHITRLLRTAGDDLWLTTGRGIRNAQVKAHHVVNVALAISNGQPAEGVEFVRKFRKLHSASTKTVRERERLNALTMLGEEAKAYEATLPTIETAVAAGSEAGMNLGEIVDSFVNFLAHGDPDEIIKSRLQSLNLQIQYHPSLTAALTLGVDPNGTETFHFALPAGVEYDAPTRRIFMRPMILDYLGLNFLTLCLKGFEEPSLIQAKDGWTSNRSQTN